MTDTYGIIRLRSRMANSDFNKETKFSILLSKNSPITKLLLFHFYVENFHAGVNQTLTTFLTRFWSSDARRQTKTVIS